MLRLRGLEFWHAGCQQHRPCCVMRTQAKLYMLVLPRYTETT